MDLLLINPSLSKEEGYGKDVKDSDGGFLPPLGLASLAAYIKEKGFQVSILDPTVDKIDIIEYIKEHNPHVIGVSALTAVYSVGIKYIKQIRKMFPEKLILFGGHHISLFKENVFHDCPEADVLIYGEGELTLLELMDTFKKDNYQRYGSDLDDIKGIIFKQCTRIITNPPRELIPDLNILPFPARELLPMDKYMPLPIEYKKLPVVHMIVSRGCPMNCIVGDTLINTVDGMIPIKDLVGNSIGVYTYNKKTGDRYIKQTINIRKVKSQAEILRVTFDDNSFIDCTPDHKFYTFKNSWKEAKNLSYGENVIALKRDNNTVIKVEFLEDKQDVYDMEVPTTHCYFANNVLIHNCTFCSTHAAFGYKARFRDPGKVLEEIKFVVKNYNAKQISFWDDILTLKKDWLITLCDLIIKEKLDIIWNCYGHINTIDNEMLKKMKQAGCFCIWYGIEAGDEQLLKNINKHIKLDKIREVVKDTRKNGIEVRGLFMLGLPGETPELAQKTINFAKELNVDYAQFSITTPHIGTQLYADAKKYGTLDEDLDKFTQLSAVFVPYGYKNAEEIEAMSRRAYMQFYYRPTYILKQFLKIRGIEDIKKYYKALKLAIAFT